MKINYQRGETRDKNYRRRKSVGWRRRTSNSKGLSKIYYGEYFGSRNWCSCCSDLSKAGFKDRLRVYRNKEKEIIKKELEELYLEAQILR